METKQKIKIKLEAKILELYRKDDRQFAKIHFPSWIQEITLRTGESIHLDEHLEIKGTLTIEEINHYYPENKQ